MFQKVTWGALSGNAGEKPHEDFKINGLYVDTPVVDAKRELNDASKGEGSAVGRRLVNIIPPPFLPGIDFLPRDEFAPHARREESGEEKPVFLIQ